MSLCYEIYVVSSGGLQAVRVSHRSLRLEEIANMEDSTADLSTWLPQLEGQYDSVLDFNTPTEEFQAGSFSLPTTLSGSSNQIVETSSSQGPIVQSYGTNPNFPLMPFSTYVIPTQPAPFHGLSIIHPAVVHCRWCGQLTGTTAVASVPPVLFNNNYSLLQTLDGRHHQ